MPVQSCVCKFTASVRGDVYPTVCVGHWWVGPMCAHLGVLKYYGNMYMNSHQNALLCATCTIA